MSIKKRYHTNKNGTKSASWSYDFYVIFGKRHQKSGFKTKLDAEKVQSEDMQRSNKGGNTTNDKKFIDSNNMVKRRFNKVLEGAGVSKIRFHDLRHTYASLLIAKDMNIKYIQKQMGHASFEITMNTYAHIMPEVYATSEVKIDELI